MSGSSFSYEQNKSETIGRNFIMIPDVGVSLLLCSFFKPAGGSKFMPKLLVGFEFSVKILLVFFTWFLLVVALLQLVLILMHTN